MRVPKDIKISKKDKKIIQKASPLIIKKNKSSNTDLFINELTASMYLREALESHKKISAVFDGTEETVPVIQDFVNTMNITETASKQKKFFKISIPFIKRRSRSRRGATKSWEEQYRKFIPDKINAIIATTNRLQYGGGGNRNHIGGAPPDAQQYFNDFTPVIFNEILYLLDDIGLRNEAMVPARPQPLHQIAEFGKGGDPDLQIKEIPGKYWIWLVISLQQARRVQGSVGEGEEEEEEDDDQEEEEKVAAEAEDPAVWNYIREPGDIISSLISNAANIYNTAFEGDEGDDETPSAATRAPGGGGGGGGGDEEEEGLCLDFYLNSVPGLIEDWNILDRSPVAAGAGAAAATAAAATAAAATAAAATAAGARDDRQPLQNTVCPATKRFIDCIL